MVFPDNLNATAIHKTDSSSDVSNYRPILVSPCFSKILERIMYIRLKKYLTDQNISYAKKIEFQVSHNTGHEVAQLNDQICESLEKKEYTQVCLLTCLKLSVLSINQCY